MSDGDAGSGRASGSSGDEVLEGVEAAHTYAELLIAKTEAMVAFAAQILAVDPHPRVRASAEQVIEQGESDIAALEALVAAAP